MKKKEQRILMLGRHIKGSLCRILGDVLAEIEYSIHNYVFIIV